MLSEYHCFACTFQRCFFLICRFSSSGQDANPTHDKDGNELSGAAIKKGKSKADSARKQRAFYEKQVTEKGSQFMENLRSEVASAQQEYQELKKQLSSLNVGQASVSQNGSNGICTA